jgi:uncharacterized protein YaeQ
LLDSRMFWQTESNVTNELSATLDLILNLFLSWTYFYLEMILFDSEFGSYNQSKFWAQIGADGLLLWVKIFEEEVRYVKSAQSVYRIWWLETAKSCKFNFC